MSKEQQQNEGYLVSLPDLCLKWIKTSRKGRKQTDWQSLYKQMLALLMPEIDQLQLLVPNELLHEQLQLFLNSLAHTYRFGSSRQVAAANTFIEPLTLNVLVLLRGTLKLHDTNETIAGPTAILKISHLKSERLKVQTQTICEMLRGQRKVLQKIKTQILKQDREIKEAFLSKHLFCGLTPVYPQTAVKLIPAKEATEVSTASENLLLLQRGLVRRKPKKRGEGSQLTQGSIMNVHRLVNLLQNSDNARPEEILTAIENSVLISFEIEEFMRILKLNIGLKQLLQRKLKLIFDERNSLIARSQQISQDFQDRFRKGAETLRLHYPIEFKNRPKTAAMVRSFRKKHETTVQSTSISDFVTFDRYDKMICSKEKVLTAKASYQVKVRQRTGVPVDYERRLKQQSKMFKLQSGKIQKMSQRESRTDNPGMRDIKKNLFRVTHLFDEPLDPNITFTTPFNRKDLEVKSTSACPLRRMSGIKPEQFLKQAYLTEFLKKRTSGPSIKNIEESSPNSGNKENVASFQCFTISEGMGFKRKPETFKITVNNIQ